MQDEELTPEQKAFDVLVNAAKKGNRSGCFELEESIAIGKAIEILKPFLTKPVPNG